MLGDLPRSSSWLVSLSEEGLDRLCDLLWIVVGQGDGSRQGEFGGGALV